MKHGKRPPTPTRTVMISVWPEVARLLAIPKGEAMLRARRGQIPGYRPDSRLVDRDIFIASLMTGTHAPPERVATWPPRIEIRVNEGATSSRSPMERRFNPSRPETRAAGTAQRVLSGCAARYGVLSADLGGFREMLAPGVFGESIRRDREIFALMNHDPSLVLGHVGSGSLALWEDNEGLKFRCELPPTTVARDAWELVRRGDISECSFGFKVTDGGESWSNQPDPDNPNRKIPVRTVHEAKLFDVSAVTYPAYSGHLTKVTASVAPAVMAASPGRSLFPSGQVPAEIRVRFPRLAATLESPRADRESDNLRAYGRAVLDEMHREDCLRETEDLLRSLR